MKKILQDLSFAETEEKVLSLGEKKFRAKQLFEGLMQGRRISDITSLSGAFKARLSEEYEDEPVRIKETFYSSDGTEKYLFSLSDGNLVEGVLMKYKYGYTQCISTQVGCRMGCKFCASTLGGLVRNLSAGEILSQILVVNALHRGEEKGGRAVTNVVLMGSGEPLDNYTETVKFLKNVTAEGGICISARNISLSTCGLVPKMYQFAEENLPVTLSVSLHAPNDEIRRQTMPVANAYPMDELLAACRNYIDKTGRRVIFEYALVGGVNCEEKHAIELASRLRGMQCHVNLIPLNAVEERHLKGVNEQTVQRFLHKLEELHISATRRREMGDDIEGACGQLRRKTLTTLHDPQGEEA